VPLGWLVGAFLLGSFGGFAAGNHNSVDVHPVTPEGHGVTIQIIPI
jgi:hypothetical protein